MATPSREIRLVAGPRGVPAALGLELAEVGLADPAEGELPFRNAFVVRLGAGA